MARSRKQNSNWNRRKQLKTQLNRRRRKRPSPANNVLKSIYQVITALPILPTPVKQVADWVARQFGLTTATKVKGQATAIRDGVVNSLSWAGFLRTSMLVTGTPNGGSFTEDYEIFYTNIRSVRPVSLTFKLLPQNPQGNRSGYYTFAFFPFTGPDDLEVFNQLAKDELGYERILVRAPLRARWPAATGGTIAYTVPKSNTFLHNGLPVYKTNADDSAGDYFGFLVINYNREDRAEYSDFTAEQVSFDLRISGVAMPMQFDPITMGRLYGSKSVKDFNENASKYVFLNPKTKETFAVKSANWDPVLKAFAATAPAEEHTMEDLEY